MKPNIRVLVCVWLLAVGPAFAANRIVNGDFENWDAWVVEGSAHPRNRWRSHNPGKYTGALLGGWATRGREGKLKQSHIPVDAGHRHLFRAWVWLDHGWTPGAQGIRIRYMDDQDRQVDEVQLPIKAPGKIWSSVKFILVPPAGATSATIEFHASDISFYGSMAIDDVYLSSAEDLQ